MLTSFSNPSSPEGSKASRTMPAGGMASPQVDPPSASPTPLQGQIETNRPLEDDTGDAVQCENDETRSLAFEFEWQSCLQHGRAGTAGASGAIAFENAEPELQQLWNLHQSSRKEQQPWEAAREAARDAWNQVQNALVDGSQPKSSAR